ncbi:MAG: peptidoglycan-associated lipoprotein Pal [Gemmatimonadales bacterium]
MRNVAAGRVLLCALLLLGTACHHAPPAQVAPHPASPSADSAAAAQARLRAEAARRDSVARAEAARREADARADAERRAREAAEAARRAIGARIYFEFDRDELSSEATATLDAKVPELRAHPALQVRVEGNADDRGSDEYNVALGQRRSAAAKRYLVARGIEASRIEVVSFGEERPVCHEEAESCWHQNRRDEFVIIAGAEALGAPRQR